MADRRRRVEDAVVAEPRLRRDSGEAARRRVVGAARRVRAGDACCDPGDMRAVERRARIQGQTTPRVADGADERARDDHLGRRPLRAALREAGRIAEAGRVEERVRLVDAFVDDADLDAGSVGAACRPQRVRADQRGALVERERIAEARVDVREAELRERRQLFRGELRLEAVEQDAVVPLDLRLGDRPRQARSGRGLRSGEPTQVEPRRARPDVHTCARRRACATNP